MMKKTMKVMKMGVGVLLLVFLVINGMGTLGHAQSTLREIQKRGTLRFGWGIWWPYVYRDAKTNELTGVSVGLVEEMAKALKVDLVWVEDQWGTFAAGIQAKKFDIWNLAAVTLPRATAVGFSEPVTVHGLSFITKEAKNPGLTGWRDMDKKGTKLSVTFGSNTDMYLTRIIQNAEIVRLKSGPECFSAMMTGRVDAYTSTIDSLTFLAKKNPGTYVVPGEFARSFVAFALPIDDQVWINWVNFFVTQMKMTGMIKRLLNKHGLDASFAAD
jgi:cyclohexadienyl dehydratase